MKQRFLQLTNLILFGYLLVSCGAKDPLNRRHRSVKLGLTNQQSPCSLNEYKSPSLNLTPQNPVLANADFSAITDTTRQLSAGIKINIKYERAEKTKYGSIHTPVSFSLGGVDLCEAQFYGKAHIINGKRNIQGKFPEKVKIPKNIPEIWPDVVDILSEAARQLDLASPDLTILEKSKCLFAEDNLLVPAWFVHFSDTKNLPYQAIFISQGVRLLRPEFLNVTGQFQIYDKNVLDQELKNIEIDHMQENGYLCSDYFSTEVDENQDRAYSASEEFSFAVDDRKFNESSVFANASRMLEWFLQKDPNVYWSGAQINLVITKGVGSPHYSNPESIKNLFRPAIYISETYQDPQTGEIALVNLDTDFDVVAHELGHHIVARHVGFENKEENIAVHEGLADFFLFAKTENPCLGESICNGNTGSCVSKTCLRQVENDLGINDPQYPKLPVHLKSQVISSMLWDLSHEPGFDLDQTTDLTLQALYYLPQTTTYQDLLSALFQADQEISNGQNACQIKMVAKKRGFNEMLPLDLNCQ